MCENVELPDGGYAIICGGRARPRYCKCGRPADLLCDWKVAGKKSGTCDEPVCKRCAVEVAANKHLCKAHQAAWESWKHRHGLEAAARVIEPQKATETQQSLF